MVLGIAQNLALSNIALAAGAPMILGRGATLLMALTPPMQADALEGLSLRLGSEETPAALIPAIENNVQRLRIGQLEAAETSLLLMLEPYDPILEEVISGLPEATGAGLVPTALARRPELDQYTGLIAGAARGGLDVTEKPERPDLSQGHWDFANDRLRALAMRVVGPDGPQVADLEVAFVEAMGLAAYYHQTASLAMEEAEHDGLTRLLNRRGLDEMTETLESRLTHRRAADQSLGDYVLMIDIDHFKRVNDTHGHQTGDLVLAAVARALDNTVRIEDIVVRYGGEEFFVYIRDTGDEGVRAAAEKLRENVAALSVPLGDDDPLSVTISIGIAPMRLVQKPDDEGTTHEGALADAIGRADEALYIAKRAGRNRFVQSTR